MHLLALLLILAGSASGLGCGGRRAVPAPAHTLTLGWQRLVDEAGATCPRCGSTEREIKRAAAELKRLLAPDGIAVRVEAERIDQTAFRKAPLESNRIWVDGRPLEDWLGATVSSSDCTGCCDGEQCRTLVIDGRTYESIPAEIIVRAGLLAAAGKERRNPDATGSPASSGKGE